MPPPAPPAPPAPLASPSPVKQFIEGGPKRVQNSVCVQKVYAKIIVA